MAQGLPTMDPTKGQVMPTHGSALKYTDPVRCLMHVW